jgi:hypothetical protein
MKESKFQADLIVELKQRFKGSMVIKNDPNYIQGIPDLLILHKDRWAALEVKASAGASRQPNQDYYVNLMDGMSFAAYICPENKDSVLDGLQQSLSPKRQARVS